MYHFVISLGLISVNTLNQVASRILAKINTDLTVASTPLSVLAERPQP